MNTFARLAGILLVALALNTRADESLPSLKVKGQLYTKVTVTSVTETDIYFTHAGGLASAKLRDLTPELQKHFHYNATKSAAIENAQRQATANYRAHVAEAKRVASNHTGPAVSGDDFVAPKLYARSIRGTPAPQFAIEKWITPPPVTRGKFVLIDFWATWCGPCRHSIPELNAFHAKFQDRLTIIGVSDESETAIRKMTDPHIDYAIATDPRQRMSRELQIQGIPHCILIDPSGVVRYEGMPQYLDDQKLEHFLDKYQ